MAIISVTDEQGRQETTGPVHRSPANPDTLLVPLRAHLPEGWYLIYWRAISVDGHPVQGAFTYAVGPNPGPAPQFRVPNISATATTPQLLIARWVMFMTVMVAIGLFVLRLLVARSLVRRVSGSSLRPLTVAFAIAAGLGLIAIPVYLDFSTANDSLRSVFDLTALVPLYRVTAYGRAIVDLELCFALFCVAAGIALWLDRPDRERRSIAELIAACGAVLAARRGAGRTGRGRARRADLSARIDAAVRLAAPDGGLGLAGRPHRRARALVQRARAVARAGAVGVRAALLERRARLGSGARGHRRRRGRRSHAGRQRPVGDGVRARDPGQDGLARRGAGDRVRQPAPLATPADRGGPRTGPWRAGRAAAAPARQRRSRDRRRRWCSRRPFSRVSLRLRPRSRSRTRRSRRSVPGRVAQTVSHAGYVLQVLVSPNKAAAPDSFALRITRGGQPVRGANVTLLFNHLEMEMPTQEYQLTETQPGVYARAAPALVMVGRWGLTFQITPPHGSPFTALIVDQANG